MIGPGAKLGRYECISTLGRGGMGEVWRARDSTLGRDVAIKTLPAEYEKDNERLSRLRREAKLLASLNHPNIATIHGLEEDAGVRFLVLELIEGATLEERIQRGPIPVAEALKIALQIADAVGAAHDRGIIHRDLKPANIKIAKNGRVKVLDFGLAKPLYTSDRPPNTRTVSHATEQGRLLGTPGYMSPEQIRGETIDTRTDIWAFGVILAEMLTGQPLLQGPTSADSLARVLAPGEVELTLPAETPPLVARTIRRCLAKDSNERLRHIGDARIDLRDSIDGSFAVLAVLAQDGANRTRIGISAAGLLIVAVAGGWFASTRMEGNAVAEHYDITTPSNLVGANPGDSMLSIATDGTRVAYATRDSLFVYSLDSGETVSIDQGFSPFFSPDGRSVAYFSNDLLLRAPAEGGTATRLAQIRSRVRGGSWGQSLIVFATNDGLFGIPVDGAGDPRLLIAPDVESGELYFSWPEILPNDRGVAFTILPEDPGNPSEIAVLDLETLTYDRLISAGYGAQYAPGGHLVYGNAGEIMSVKFNARTFRIEADPVRHGHRVAFGAPGFDVSATGTLAFAPPPPPPNVSTVWVDPANGGEVEAGLDRPFIYSRLSPDSSRVVGDNAFDGNRDLFIWDFERSVETRLTGDPKEDLFGYFSPDGNSVYFTSNRLDNRMKIFVVPIDRSREPELVYGDDELDCWLMDVLSDRILVMRTLAGGGREFVTIKFEEPREPQLIVSLAQGGLNPVASPNERWLAYQSNETDRTEIWVRSLDAAAPAQAQISRAGGYYPQWSPDGRTIYYFAFDGAMMAVDLNDGSTLVPGSPYEVFAYRYRSPVTGPVIADSGRLYDVARDGRLLMSKSTAADAKTIRVVRGFSSLLD